VKTLTIAPTQALSDLRHRWTSAFVVGEMVGFVPPAVCGATLAAVGAPDLVLVVGLTLAGLLEGMAIGVAQARVLAHFAPAVNRRDWVTATMLGAGFAWFVGMGGGALMGGDVAPPILLAAILVPAWCAALLSMGYLQWRVMRRTVPRSGRWVWVTAGAWLLGVMIPIVVLTTAPNSWPGWVHVAIGVLGAMAMGLTVGTLTGRTLERLLKT
jgi:MFS family permease